MFWIIAGISAVFGLIGGVIFCTVYLNKKHDEEIKEIIQLTRRPTELEKQQMCAPWASGMLGSGIASLTPKKKQIQQTNEARKIQRQIESWYRKQEKK